MEKGGQDFPKEWKGEAKIFLRNRREARISTRNGKPRPGFFSGIGRGGQKNEARIFSRNGKWRPGFSKGMEKGGQDFSK